MTRLTLQDIRLPKTVKKFSLLYNILVFQYHDERHDFRFNLLLCQVTLLEIYYFTSFNITETVALLCSLA